MGRDSKGLWIITKSHIGGKPRKSMAVTDENQFNCTIPFKLYDDDDELYYSGMIAPETLNADEWLAFEPLDWAAAYAGATRMDYLNPKTGKWETL